VVAVVDTLGLAFPFRPFFGSWFAMHAYEAKAVPSDMDESLFAGGWSGVTY